MSDIVERLRRMADMTTTGNDLADIGRAANEIERLREALKEIARLGATTGYGRGALRVIARRALGMSPDARQARAGEER